MNTFTRYQGSALFLPSDLGDANAQLGYLLPVGVSSPDSFGLADALNSYAGWFILFADLPAATADFVAAAQGYLSNPARAGVLLAWFSNPDQYAQGLAASLLVAPRVTGQPIVLTRPGLIEFANFTVNLTPGTLVGLSEEQNSLVFTAGGTTNSLAVTAFGQRQPVALPLSGAASLPLLTAGANNGCLNFAINLDSTAAQALDLGLRSYTAPPEGGYASTLRYPIFDIAACAGGVALTATIDPLQPLNEARSFFSFATATSLPSHYRTPVGGSLALTPQDDACLVFCNRLTAVDAQGNPIILPGRNVLYLIPKGGFQLSTGAASAAAFSPGGPSLAGNLMCGLSAVEYLGLGTSNVLHFVTGNMAFAPTLQMPDPGKGLTRIYGAPSHAAQTSWAYLSSSEGSTYYAQPDSAVVYQPGGTSAMMNYLPIPTAELPALTTSGANSPPCFPLLPYAALQAGSGLGSEDAVQFETQVLSPQRRREIARFGMPSSRKASLAATTAMASTPQGMLLNLSGAAWSQLTLAVSPSTAPAGRSQTLVLDDVQGDFQAALQSNQLFLVVSDGDALLRGAGISYSLTAERLDVLKNLVKLDPAVITALQPLVGQRWVNLASCEQALQTALQQNYASNRTRILSNTGDFSLFVADWEFDLSPWRWGDHNTLALFKFCNKALEQLVSDTSQWAYADEFNPSPSAVQSQLQAIISDAKTRLAGGDTDFAFFVNQVVSNPDWNGLLLLNAEVPLSGLPMQMEGLAAGIDLAQFKAHHLGINITPVSSTGGQLSALPSSVFALIDYEDPGDLVGTALDYQFKVNTLKVLIGNSEVSAFSSSIELMINKLFGEPAQQLGASSNCLKLQGYYQSQGGIGSYSFVARDATAYRISSGVLDQLSITGARFITLAKSDASQTRTDTRFYLSGAISFKNQPGFDLFSYGPQSAPDGSAATLPGLVYNSLSIDMGFDVATPSYKTFGFDAHAMLLDPPSSQTRASSLAAHFPMRLSGLIQASGSVTPDSLGYMPVDSPLAGSAMTPPWFGLQYDLDLGSPGALAAQVGFTAGLLLAWSPNPSGTSLYIGLSLPGVSGGQRAISLQGVLTLAFGDVRFVVDAPSYMLQLRNIALKFLSLTFPPNGQTNLLLFGNPNAQTSGALGWYASYMKNGAGKKKTPNKAPALPPK